MVTFRCQMLTIDFASLSDIRSGKKSGAVFVRQRFIRIFQLSAYCERLLIITKIQCGFSKPAVISSAVA